MQIRDRIKELRRVPAKDLRPNPRNWRLHPSGQADALRGLLAEIGYADALIAYTAADGVLVLIDGHLRAETTPDMDVPVLVTDLTEDEADKLILTLDPLAGMAGRDNDVLKDLLSRVNTDSDAVRQLMNSLMPAGLDWNEDVDNARAAELQKKWGTEMGQVWQVRSRTVTTHVHRIIIGDSTDRAVANSLLDGAKVEMVVTDPSYDLDAKMVQEAIEHLCYRAVVLSAQRQAFTLCTNGWEHRMDFCWRRRTPRSAYPNSSQPIYYHNIILAMEKVDPAKAEAVKTAVEAAAEPDELHGLILMLTRGRIALGWKRPEKNFGSVIEVEGPEFINNGLEYGKAPKLFVEMMRGFTWLRWADPFLGTGTSLLAAETLGRLLYGAEISPGITAVALERLAIAGLRAERAA